MAASVNERSFGWTEEALLGALREAESCEELPWMAGYGRTKEAWEGFCARAIPRMQLQSAPPAVSTVVAKFASLKKLYSSHVKERGDRGDFRVEDLGVQGVVDDMHHLSQLIVAIFEKEDQAITRAATTPHERSLSMSSDGTNLTVDIDPDFDIDFPSFAFTGAGTVRRVAPEEAQSKEQSTAAERVVMRRETRDDLALQKQTSRDYELARFELEYALGRAERVAKEKADRDHELVKMRLQHQLDHQSHQGGAGAPSGGAVAGASSSGAVAASSSSYMSSGSGSESQEGKEENVHSP